MDITLLQGCWSVAIPHIIIFNILKIIGLKIHPTFFEKQY